MNAKFHGRKFSGYMYMHYTQVYMHTHTTNYMYIHDIVYV